MNLFSRLLLAAIIFPVAIFAQPVIYVNQVGFDSHGPKIAIFGSALGLPPDKKFQVINFANGKVAFTAALTTPLQVKDWATGKIYYQADFSSFNTSDKYYITVTRGGVTGKSPAFVIEEDALAKLTIPSIIHYYNKQRANTPQEIAADSKVNLYGSDKTVDMHGGWCDASGDVSKYFSHLAYTNYVSPQQTPLVVWSLANAVDAIPGLLSDLHVKDSMVNEA
ncbi:MAG TPA: cellulase N-terminal Ig-like domain-containing protein [Chitinophagaceae bacterium]|nr:cellulase N-terminal Ig-like domain-containing protein [Chitinophagaceae bacterium]